DADREELKKIEEHRQSVLGQILTPEEQQEFDLRTSETADRLREQLIGFNPNEEEFRAIYALLKSHDDKFAYVDSDADENARNTKAQEEDQLQDTLRNNSARIVTRNFNARKIRIIGKYVSSPIFMNCLPPPRRPFTRSDR